MKAVFVLFDSLCRNALGCYGSPWVKTPNFDRFAARGVTFDSHFVGSPQSMWLAGIHTHLVSDHLHYFEDGGATYHNRFRTWDFIRGQEYDAWKAMVQPPVERLRAKYAAKHYN